MKEKITKYGEPKNITNPGQDSVVYRFTLTMVDADFVGKPDERQKTSEHRIVVEYPQGKRGDNEFPWSFSETDFVKYLFRECTKAVEKRFTEKGELDREVKVLLLRQPTCPVDPSRIEEPYGAVVTVE